MITESAATKAFTVSARNEGEDAHAGAAGAARQRICLA
jgi:hypothetical protein